MSEGLFAEKPAAESRAETEGRRGGLFSHWRQELRERIVRRGIEAMCGSADFVPTSAADDVSLISGGLRLAWLRVLGAVGIKEFVAMSGLGYRFVCHIGDLAEYPFYHRRAFQKELALCAAWLHREDRPVVYDLGANVGFISTHLAQILEPQLPQIYAFEPAPATFARLVGSVRRLGLNDRIHPIAAAAIDETRPVFIRLSEQNSMLSQVVPDVSDLRHSNGFRHANGFAYAAGITLDEFSATVGAHPTLVKMDVEGSEVAALRGARRLLSGERRPAIAFEHNPVALAECGASAHSLRELLAGYAFYYIDDLDGQKLPFGSAVADLGQVDWTCNLFAAPASKASDARWASVLSDAQSRLANGAL
jgi:FkbM family methyltransferase